MISSRNYGISEKPTGVGSTSHSQIETKDQSHQLSDLQSETAYVQTLLHSLVQSQYHLKRELNARSAPILQLPPELLSEIFIIYASGSVWSEWIRRHRSPLILGKVCNSWRELAWSIPKLWSSIWLELWRNKDPALVDQWLVRSGKLPLSICASLHSSTSLAVVAVLDVVARHAERWFRVIFNIPLSCYDVFECVKGRLHSLEYISLQVEETEEERDTLEMFGIAAQLHTVRLKGYFPFLLPTAQLKTLCIDNDYVDECLDILRLSPLVNCEFKVVRHSLGGMPPNVFAAELESLKISILDDPAVLAMIFDTLTVPAAREFICQGLDVIDFPHASFISLMSRSSCSLQILCLDSFDISDSDLIECLRAVPLLRELILDYTNITEELFRMLHPGHPSNSNLSNVLLPRLERFEYSGDLGIDFTVLISLLCSRWDQSQTTLVTDELQNVARLKSFKFYSRELGRPDPQSFSQLQDLAREGMEIMVDGTWLEDHLGAAHHLLSHDWPQL